MPDQSFLGLSSRPSYVQRLLRSEHGNVTSSFAIAFLAVFLASGSAIDYSRFLATRTALTAATDAAALQIANSKLTNQTALEAQAAKIIERNYPQDRHGELTEIDLAVDNSSVDLKTRVKFKTSFMKLAGIDDVDLVVVSQVKKSGNNLEVALVLDVTQSMAGTKINALKSAAKEFVDIVVWDTQTPFYSKVALVPYSSAVNVGSLTTTVRGSVTSGTCTSPGCARYRFNRTSGDGGGTQTYNISNCVTERTGTYAFTDQPPSVAKMGRHYAPNCLNSQVKPLRNSKSDIKDDIDALNVQGSTAGHIGFEWGWYALSKDVGLWTGTGEPAAYGTAKLKKIAVVMTDGEFNTAYCNGVQSKNSINYGSDRINCDATNGNSFTQAKLICAEMKKKNIEIYTIGFDVGGNADVIDVLTTCASGGDHVFLAATSAELTSVFKSIGKKLTALRISM
jgi:Flp pilus assembly protein TadG